MSDLRCVRYRANRERPNEPQPDMFSTETAPSRVQRIPASNVSAPLPPTCIGVTSAASALA